MILNCKYMLSILNGSPDNIKDIPDPKHDPIVEMPNPNMIYLMKNAQAHSHFSLTLIKYSIKSTSVSEVGKLFLQIRLWDKTLIVD